MESTEILPSFVFENTPNGTMRRTERKCHDGVRKVQRHSGYRIDTASTEMDRSYFRMYSSVTARPHGDHSPSIERGLKYL